MSGIAYALRESIRRCLSRPQLTLAIVISLSLGIGVNCAVFSVLWGVALRPLPYNHSDRIVVIKELVHRTPQRIVPYRTVSPKRLAAWRSQQSAFEAVAAFQTPVQVNLSNVDRPDVVSARAVSVGFFEMLGARTDVGSFFEEGDDETGSERKVVLSHRLWVQRFGAEREVIGSTILLDDQPYVVVGVLSRQFSFLYDNTQAWLAAKIDPENGRSRSFTAVAKLKSGRTLRSAETEIDTLQRRLTQSERFQSGAALEPLQEYFKHRRGGVLEIQNALLILLGAVLIVSLVSVSNLTSLLLGRVRARYWEAAVRAVLGATRPQLALSQLLEGLLLAAFGVVVGVLLSYWAIEFVLATSPFELRGFPIRLDVQVVAFACLIGLFFGLLLALAPSLLYSNPDLGRSLRASSFWIDLRQRRFTDILLTGQVAVSVLLLISAGLMLNSFVRLTRLDLGFDPDRLLTATLRLSESKYALDIGQGQRRLNSGLQLSLVKRVQDRLNALPGVEAVGVTSSLMGESFFAPCRFEGVPQSSSSLPTGLAFQLADARYFEALKIPVVRGRGLSDHPSVVVNESAARVLWPNEEPAGSIVFQVSSVEDRREIVGVVRDTRNYFNQDSRPVVYVPYSHPLQPDGLDRSRLSASFVISVRGQPQFLNEAVRQAVLQADPHQPVSRIASMDRLLSDQLGEKRFYAWVLAFLAFAALTLTSIGTWSIVSYIVAQRKHEIGVRVTLGASPISVAWAISRRIVLIVLVGIALGCSAGRLLSGWIDHQLYGIAPGDLATYASAVLLALFLSAAASLIPARRAWKVDPAVTLRCN